VAPDRPLTPAFVEGLNCGMHIARLHRHPAAFEHNDDCLPNPVVPTMPVPDGGLRSRDVVALRPAFVAIELVERPNQQRLQVCGGVGMVSG